MNFVLFCGEDMFVRSIQRWETRFSDFFISPHLLLVEQISPKIIATKDERKIGLVFVLSWQVRDALISYSQDVSCFLAKLPGYVSDCVVVDVLDTE